MKHPFDSFLVYDKDQSIFQYHLLEDEIMVDQEGHYNMMLRIFDRFYLHWVFCLIFHLTCYRMFCWMAAQVFILIKINCILDQKLISNYYII